MKTRAKMLKVKIKSLAEEARIIRLEESRAGKDDTLRNFLHYHRISDVRREQRASLLAYGFIRGREYAAIEPKCDKAPEWDRVAKLVSKFGLTSQYGYPASGAVAIDQLKAFEAWKSKETATCSP